MGEVSVNRFSDRGSIPLISILGFLDLKVGGANLLGFQHFKNSPASTQNFCRAIFA